MFGLFAEIERDLISERTREGLVAACAKGQAPVPAQLAEKSVRCSL